MRSVGFIGLIFLTVFLLFGCTQTQAPPVVVTYTAMNVGSHNVPEDCWVAFNDGTYDITPLTINLPEGVTSKLSDLCGSDATTTFAQAGSAQKPASQYYIGKYFDEFA